MTKKVKKMSEPGDLYASMESFCSYFLKEIDSLYQLAFLLTGSQQQGEECVVAALEDCRRAKVFKPWLESWSRLSVIDRALKTVADKSAIDAEKGAINSSAERDAILQLNRFERLVYTLSVLEKYSVKDCAILLRAARREVAEAKSRAIHEVSMFLAAPHVTQEDVIALGA